MGVARSDPEAILSVPEATLPRTADTPSAVAALATELGAVTVYVGLPLTLGGEEGLAAEAAIGFAKSLAALAPCPVRMVDERLSTVSAQRALRAAGRSEKQSRSVVDQAAAVLILEHALSVERASGNPAGTAVTVDPEDGEEGPV